MKILRITCLLLIAALLCGMNVSAEDVVMPESIKIVLSNTNMQIGETQTIQVSVSPTNAENYELEYNSSNSQVVTAAIGTLLANAEGTAEITVSVKGTQIADKVTVTVGNIQEVVPVSDIELRQSYMYLQKYDEEKIYYTVLPDNAANKNVVFTSLNTSIVTVDADGWVYAKKVGSTQVKIQSEDKTITKYVDIHVEDDAIAENDSDDEISVRRVDIFDGEDEVFNTIEIMKTQTKQFTAHIYPDTASDQRIRWRSSDDNIAEVDENGILTGALEGTATIYATARDNGRYDSITVKVIPYVRYPDSISIAPPEEVVFETEQIIIFSPSFSPADTTERNLRWFVDGGCATIDGNGKVTITDKGKIKVKAYTSDWKQSAVYEFDVVYSSTHFTKVSESYNMKANRAIVIEFDENVSLPSSQANIFAATNESGNMGYTDVKIIVDGRRVTIIPVNGWSAGANYIFIKEGLSNAEGNKIGKNLKFIFTVRSGVNEKI